MASRDSGHSGGPGPITVEEAEGLYGITLTEHEKMLLITARGLLTPIESQEKFVLSMALEPVKCPVCPLIICRRSAVVGGVFDMNKSTPDEAYECPGCHTRLTWWMALFGPGQGFTISPGQTVTIS